MDNNEQRHRTAGRGPAPISLPAVAWHAAGEEPAAEPVAPRPPLTLPVLTPEAPTGAVRPEPAAEPEPGAAPGGGAVPEVPVPAAEEAAGAEEIAEAEEVAEAEETPQEAAPDALAATPVAAPAAPTGLRPARRIPKPMLAAAATSGVVLMGVPLLFSQLGGDAGPGRVPSRPTGYNQPDGGPEGFVPGTDVPDKGSVLPGAVAPGAAADAPGQGAANTPVTNTGTGQSGDGQGSPGGGPAGGPAAGSGGTSGNPGSAGSPDTGARHDPQQSGPAPQAPPPAPAKKEYAAVAGPGCAGEGAAFSRNGWYTDGKEGWKSYGTGGYGSSGCNGDFLAMPMSGDGQDAGKSMLWTFRTGAVTTGTCQVSVHVPNNGDIKAVGGKPSYYTVHGAASASGPTLGSFTVNQPSQLGRWVGAGSFRITGGQLAVKLHDRGQDWSGSTKTYAHHAGDAVRVQCTSS
ncbi:hypothetical protein J7E99_38810 [Streptomyces sp. ISL-44]|uniref:hypothetical protein n=2 Tax=unclassified Streptomyces TaxID=2593676 RepID=UPI001BE79833|nr:hypothetical protein [Streptomyces sp. ISL-44]MBT2546455.1 hypothetical protein [Streptomyces sp. ISL-44]